jgi:peptide/nickel transport system ATP-binding protein
VSLLEVKNLRVEFPTPRGAFAAVDDVSLALEAGEILGIVGESGSGKTTVGNAVIDLVAPPGRIIEGEVWLEGKRIDGLGADKIGRIRGRRIGIIFQDPQTSLDPLQTIEQHLVETIKAHRNVSVQDAKLRGIELLSQLGIADAEARIKHYPHQFSGGMRQRAVIALAICADPEVLIADEPTTNLDVSVQAQILEHLKRLSWVRRIGIILITHNIGVVAETADRVAVMYRGRFVEKGNTENVLGHPEHPYTKHLVSAVPRLDGQIRGFQVVARGREIGHGLGMADVARPCLNRQRVFRPIGGPLLALERVKMTFVARRSLWPKLRRYVQAVDDVSFEIQRGESFGLVGESGSGKSTIGRLITGLYRPTCGRILFAETDRIAIRSPTERASYSRQIQMIFQDPYSSLNPRMRIADILAEPIDFHRLSASRRETKDMVHALLGQVGLGPEAARKFPYQFSGGERQRISIARAVASRPRFLICDEPTSALDVSIQAQILGLLKDLRERLGLTMLFISHDLPVVRQMCDRVGVMRQGKIVEIANTEDLFENARHDYTKQLLSLVPNLDLLYRQ